MNIKPYPRFKPVIIISLMLCSTLLVFSNMAAQAGKSAQLASLRLITHEVSLGKSQPGEVEYSRVISRDQTHIAYTVTTNEGEFVAVDGVPGKTYTSIPQQILTEAGVAQQIKFSDDGRRVAYVARRGQKFLVVVDGQEGHEFDGIEVGAPTFSPDSRRVAYFAKRGGRIFAVVDGIESKPFDTSHAHAPHFSPDSRHVVYLANHGKQTNVVIDGVETVEAGYVGEPEFSKTGKRMAYTLDRGDKWVVVIDGKKGKPYDGLGNNLEFSDDEKHVLYQADTPRGHVVVVDGVETDPYPIIQENSYGFSPDGLHVAFRGADNRDAEYVVVDNKRGKTYSGVGSPTFSPDSRHVSYAAWHGGKFMVVTDGIEGESFEEVNDYFRFSPDGKRMAYRAKRDGRQFLVVDGVATASDKIIDFKFSPDSRRLLIQARNGNTALMILEGEPPKQYELTPSDQSRDSLLPMAFSPDSQRTAWVARRSGKSFVVSDGSEGKAYEEIKDLQFTSDGKHLVYAARRGGKVLVVVDGAESKEYDGFVDDADLVLDGPRTIRMMVSRGREMFRLEIEIGE